MSLRKYSSLCNLKSLLREKQRVLIGRQIHRKYHSSNGATHYDVVVAGGGIMGCSSGYFLGSQRPDVRICIVERDTSYKKASTVLSIGSIRQQFSNKTNILLSMWSYKFIKNISQYLSVSDDDPADVQFMDGGYLILAGMKGKEILEENVTLQRSLGASIELSTPTELQHKYPWLNTNGLSMGSLGTANEGWFDPHLLLQAFLSKLKTMNNIDIIKGEVTGLCVQNDRINGLQITHDDNSITRLSCDQLVNTGGAHSAAIARMAGIGKEAHPHPLMTVGLPIRPRKRMVFVVKSPLEDFPDVLFCDPSGFYVRKEIGRSTFLVGLGPPQSEDPDSNDLEVDYDYFNDKIWPLLAERIPAFEAVKVVSAWAGWYDFNTFDQNGIIGRHPIIDNLIFATGFSGHGIQQSPAVGRAVSEIILHGHSISIDVTDMGFHRVIKDEKNTEQNIV